MRRGTELELPYLTMDEDAFAEDPFPHFARARAQHPWLARWTLGYVVTDYRAMRDFFTQEHRMRMMYDSIVDIMDADETPWGEFQKRHKKIHTSASALGRTFALASTSRARRSTKGST
jgi:hypothetical protein